MASLTEITVVMATKNRAAKAARMVRALAASTGVGLKVVVVDDGSDPDQSRELKRQIGTYPLVSLVVNDRSLGPATARNLGFELVRSEFVAFVDDDDLVAPSFFSTILKAIREQSALWGFGAAIVTNDDLDIVGFRPALKPEPILKSLLQSNMVPASGLAVTAKADVVRDIGGYDPSTVGVEDWNFVIQLAQRGEPAIVAEPLLAFHHVSVGSVSANTDRLKRAARELEVRYRADYERFGVELDWGALYQYLVIGELLGGRRFRASTYAARTAILHRQPRSLVRAAAALASPRWALCRSERILSSDVDPTNAAVARTWLDAIHLSESRTG